MDPYLAYCLVFHSARISNPDPVVDDAGGEPLQEYLYILRGSSGRWRVSILAATDPALDPVVFQRIYPCPPVPARISG